MCVGGIHVTCKTEKSENFDQNELFILTKHFIELPKSCRKHILVLKMNTPNSRYRLLKMTIKIREITKAIAHGTKAKIGRFGSVKNL